MNEGRWAGRLGGAALVALALTLLLGAAGGAVARVAGLPIPLLLGSITVTAAVALSGLRPLGRTPFVPNRLRSVAMIVVGVSIGGTVTPQVLERVADWLPSLLTLLLYLPIAHAVSYMLFRLGGISRAEAWFGSVPGGLIETVQMADEAGVKTPVVTVLQFLRLILTVMAVPIIFTVATGHPVGSAAGMRLPGGAAEMGFGGFALLVLIGGLGAWVAARLRLPAAPMLGSMLLSAVAHGSGLPLPHIPDWLIGATQVMIGCALGARFADIPRSALVRAAGLAAGNTVVTLSIALVFALVLSALSGQSPPAVFLAYAPGGVAEMSLVALSLQIDVVFVSLHHLLRISLSVIVARIGASRLMREPPE